MFDIFSWQHILTLLVVALVVVGPKDLPRLMNIAGKWAGKARAMANEFRKSFDEMARQAELDELRKEIEELKKNNPVTDMMNAVEGATAGINTSLDMASENPVAVETAAPLEGEVAPRSGEFEVTDSAAVPAPSTTPSSAP